MPTTTHKRTIRHSTHGETRIKPGVVRAPEPVVKPPKPLQPCDSSKLPWDEILNLKYVEATE